MIVLEKIIFLKGVSFFKMVKEESLFSLASLLEEETVEPGKQIIQKGELGTVMYMIIEGRVKVHDGDTVLKELGEKKIFGELAALSPEKRIASVSSVEKTVLLKIESSSLYELMEGDMEFVKAIIEILCQRVREMSLDLRQMG